MELTSSTLDATLYIQTLNADGGTAGHQGLSWGWQLISPTWSGVFDGTATPQPYDDPEVKKAIILMTDGEFIHQLYSGQGSSADQARTLCDNIKAEGILIYTIAFQAPLAGEEVMSYCASGNEFACSNQRSQGTGASNKDSDDHVGTNFDCVKVRDSPERDI